MSARLPRGIRKPRSDRNRGLTNLQRQVVVLLAGGLTEKEAAAHLDIGYEAVLSRLRDARP